MSAAVARERDLFSSSVCQPLLAQCASTIWNRVINAIMPRRAYARASERHANAYDSIK